MGRTLRWFRTNEKPPEVNAVTRGVVIALIALVLLGTLFTVWQFMA